MKTIIYQPGGQCISDFEVSKFLDQIILQSGPVTVTVSNFLLIEEVRARIAEDIIAHDLIEIKVISENGLVPFKIDKHGRSEDWVPAMNVYEDLLTRIILPRLKTNGNSPKR